MASIGHELQHAVEALSEAGVRTNALIYAFFERLSGSPSARGQLEFETEAAVKAGDAVRNFSAFVISGDAYNFSVGAHLMQLLLAVQEGEWDDIDLMVRAFQRMTASIKFCPRPVVVAPFGFCLGGGAEIAIHGARRHARC